MRRELTEQEIDERINDLCHNFANYLARFDKEEPFAGPSLYFHQRAVQHRRELKSPGAAIRDECFREYLYATLAAWGLVRMGGTRMYDFATFTRTLTKCSSKIEELGTLLIDELTESEANSVAKQICEIIGHLKITEASAKLVANTKALHHLLPDLVPPIDRQHVGWFFRWHPVRLQVYQEPFMDMFPRFCKIARIVNPCQYVGSGWHTSRTKVIDNAIVGFSLAHTGKGAE